MKKSKFTHKDVFIDKLIGKGASADVYEGFLVKNNKKLNVAIKIIKKEYIDLLNDEVKIIKNLSHPNIINVIADFYYDSTRWIVFELCEFGNLSDYINKYKIKINEEDIKIIFKQIAEGLNFLHINNIMHRDLKLDNIFVNKDFIVKIGDFGFAKNDNKNILNKSCLGTPIYMAPEIYNKVVNYDKNCDIWSLGIILLELIYGKTIFNFQDITEILPKIVILKEKIKSKSNNSISKELKDLIIKLLEINAQKRIEINEILQHPWLIMNDIKKKDLMKIMNKKNNVLIKKIKLKQKKSVACELIYKIIKEFNKVFIKTIKIINKIECIINNLIKNDFNEELDFIFSLYLKMTELIYKILLLNGLKTNLPPNINEVIYYIIQKKTDFNKYKEKLLIKLDNNFEFIKKNKFEKINLKKCQENIVYKFIKFIQKIILNEVELIKNSKNKSKIINKYKLCFDIKEVLSFELKNFNIDFRILKNIKNFTNKKLLLFIEKNIDNLKEYYNELEIEDYIPKNKINVEFNCIIEEIFNSNSIKEIFNPIEIAINLRINKINNN